MPDRFARLIAMNTTLATGDVPVGPGFLAWQAYSNRNPDLDIAWLIRRGTPVLNEAEAAAYAAPYPDVRYKAGVRAFPKLVPTSPEMDGAETSRRARTWWQTQWNGGTFLATGVQDPVLGVQAARYLHSVVRNSPEPVEYPEGGHFLQEWGDQVARDALRAFGGS
jgi:haloalkane dehalogenase/tRNA(adenine34) deaminase